MLLLAELIWNPNILTHIVLLLLLLLLESAIAARIPSLASESTSKCEITLGKQLLLTEQHGKIPKTVFLNTSIQLESFLLLQAMGCLPLP